eukprot:1137162-Pelagomonas_calceolata.AAC.4
MRSDRLQGFGLRSDRALVMVFRTLSADCTVSCGGVLQTESKRRGHASLDKHINLHSAAEEALKPCLAGMAR